MKSKIIAVLLTLIILPSVTFCREEKTEIGKIVGKEYRQIRYDILKNAFTAFNYNNKAIIKKYSTNIFDASKQLKADSTADKKMITITGNIPNIDGDYPDTCFKVINFFLTQVSKGCKKNGKDISWVNSIKKRINSLNDEYLFWCKCVEKNDYSDYSSKYNTGLFIKLIPADKANSHENPSDDNTPSTKEQSTKAAGKTGSKEKQTENNKIEINNTVSIILVIIALLVGGYLFYRKRYSSMNLSNDKQSESSTENKPMSDINVESSPQKATIDTSTKDNSPQTQLFKREDSEPFPKVNDEPAEPETAQKEWIIVGASVKGNGHIQSNMPCQDNHKFESLGNGWGIAIVSDGAGSAVHSELGSKVVVERGLFHFKNLLEKEGWMKKNELPTDIEWLQKSYYTLKAVRDDVDLVSKKNNVELGSLSATCLAVIYSPIGLLTVHVGDGRMGYKSKSGEWQSIMKPHKGEEANQTIFLVSDFWNIPNYVMSNVLVPESIVVREPVRAFALMSDGCENTAWKCTVLNPETGKYYDQNKPFEGFFNPLEETLLSFHYEKVPDKDRQDKWYKFIESGTNGFVKEQDDKTMIYGLLI